jgi:hypothetical protein
MKPTLMTVTPKIAKEMLGANNKNRRMSAPHVAKLAKAMRDGHWKVNGDQIRISTLGNVVDGQHRLMAVVRSGVSIKTWVMYDVPEDVFDTIDVGKRRSSADTLSCLGEKDARTKAAALTMIERYMTGKGWSQIEYSNTEMEGLLQKYPDVGEHLVWNKSRTPLLPASLMNCCHYLFWRKDPIMAEEFVQKISKGGGHGGR